MPTCCCSKKGEPLPLDGSTPDVEQVIRKARFKSREAWLDKDGKRFVPEEYFNVGGNTKWYEAALLRVPCTRRGCFRSTCGEAG